ncbi:MAG: hypothetical protein A2408_02590 [Candidatus Yonathbacteria bacterium RIFOXYC1_FULL_52_10]|uniref:Methyltransferase domain-containing protein n=1 Tax=Candidatus Yonathbacteria bacterium RIFOXYD1_FULL_52_36 TaxID=1802730 RepID=A0A1G2SLK3_9BACT|nr:MAG: hypothetical protein A2408_02590 [Candidatus Yonathbacteria bacterium RIFOXYC1_FULL_52_10]OHA85672.1 MAG: hypothetical protein A2591_02460 [Candidatus Yonathbacteria bacterium RIFOXYD1_FULL_52_36]
MNPEDVRIRYNVSVADKRGGDYEHKRWFSSAVARAGFFMTKITIERHAALSGKHIEHYLELGPGPGTWTKLFLERDKASAYDLVDISSEMLGLAQENLSAYSGNVHFFEKNFLEFNEAGPYNFFFSSRALEYFPDKEVLVKKIAALLVSGGEGFVITKTPKYAINKLIGRKTSDFHSGQVDPKALTGLFEAHGCTVVGVYPVTFNFPLFRAAPLNRALFAIFSCLPLNPISQFFSESYAIKFIKR